MHPTREAIHILRSALFVILATHAGLTLAAPGDTTLYKSIRPDGKTVYSDRPPNAGESRKMTFENLPASPLSAATLAYLEELKKFSAANAKAAVAAAAPSNEVILFTTAWCGYCKKARAYLAAKRVPYREVDIETKNGAAAYAQAGGRGGVPFLVGDGKRVAGFSVPAYDAVFPVAR